MAYNSGYYPQYNGGAYQHNSYTAAPQLYGAYPTQQPGMLNARFVTGREEAVAAQVIPDGNICLFADMANGRIYSKQVNPHTGQAEFCEYVRKQPIQQQAEHNDGGIQYAPYDQFEALKREVLRLREIVNKEADVND